MFNSHLLPLLRTSSRLLSLPSPRCLSSSSLLRQSQGSPDELVVESPFSGDVVYRALRPDDASLRGMADLAARAQRQWQHETTLEQRLAVCADFLLHMERASAATARLISLSMGKPLAQALGELQGMASRARTMMALAPQALAPLQASPSARIAHEPVGVVLLIAPWNYPLLTAVNCLVPAVLAGNAVLLKHSPRTPHCADALQAAFSAAGAPHGLVQAVHASDLQTERLLIPHPAVQFVSFTGSVATGRRVYLQAAAQEGRFLDCTLELGGKDAAYVASDADLASAVPSLVDGAMYNAGQSCCAVERVYVHRSQYAAFVEAAAALVRSDYALGDPLAEGVNMGPMALPQAPAFLEAQVRQAVAGGATLHCGGKAFSAEGAPRSRFFQPTVLSGCGQGLDVMQRESFGPVLPISAVDSDAEAVARINDSQYGLTAAVYTRDAARAEQLGAQLQVGTVFMNRCDALDPLLPWSGHKETGKGVSLSVHGFRGVTRLKAYNFKV